MGTGIKRKVEKVGAIARVYGTNLAVDLGLVAAWRGYERFVILGRGRSGSNLLRSLIDAHSRTKTFGELFRQEDFVGWDTEGYIGARRGLELFHNDPARFLDTKVFRKYPRRVSAVGFKLFYNHARQQNWEPVWPYVRDGGFKVLHLRRRNILAAHLSLQRAFRTNVWENRGGAPEDDQPIELDYGLCLEAFELTRERERAADAYFAESAVLQLTYEDLAADRDSHMRRVFEFLGLPYEQVEPAIHRQRSLPLSAAIANFDDLRERFAGSEWAVFFEE